MLHTSSVLLARSNQSDHGMCIYHCTGYSCCTLIYLKRQDNTTLKHVIEITDTVICRWSLVIPKTCSQF